MDTTGVHHLLTLQRRLNRQRRGLTVVCAPGVVYRTLHTLGRRESLNVVCHAAAERDGARTASAPSANAATDAIDRTVA